MWQEEKGRVAELEGLLAAATSGSSTQKEKMEEVEMSMRRERACLAQRAEAGARLTGLTKRTIRNMLTELFAHAWPRRWAVYAALGKKKPLANGTYYSRHRPLRFNLFDTPFFTSPLCILIKKILPPTKQGACLKYRLAR